MPSAEYEPPIPSQDFSFDSFQDINSGLEKAAEQYPIISPTFGSFFNTQNTKKKFRNPPGLSFKTVTGKSLSEALIFASTNPQYDDRLFIELQVQYMKIPSSNL